MISTIKYIVNFIIQPINFLGILLLIIGFVTIRKNFKWQKRLAKIFMVVFLLSGTWPLPDLLLSHLESQYLPLLETSTLEDKPVDILVLGSGHTLDPDLPPNGQLSEIALKRLSEGVRIYHNIPGSKMIFSGYASKSKKSQAEVMRDAAIDLGVDRGDILIQDNPSSTSEEARAWRKSSDRSRTLVLVTSAFHMPRSMKIFQLAGLNPIPAPANFRIIDDPDDGFNFRLFSVSNFENVSIAMHEYIGMLWEKITGESVVMPS